MSEVVGAILNNAVGAALSPLPIIGVILILMGKNAGVKGAAYCLGFLLGTALPAGLAIVLKVGASGSEDQNGGGIVNLVLGALMLYLAWQQWATRPKPGEEATLPGWMASLTDASVLTSLGMGVALAIVNPKNLPLNINTGTLIAGTGEPGGDEFIALVVYGLVASLSLIIPVFLYLVAKDWAKPRLADLKDWLVDNNHTIMTILLGVLGAGALGNGISVLGS